jgi:hypothetical protein
MVMTSDGGFAIAGRTESFGAGSADFWLVKTDEFGYMEWNKTYGGENFEFARSLIATSDGGYVLLGHTLLIKTDSYGNVEWNQTYGGTEQDTPCSLVVTPDGGYAIAGDTWSSGAGEDDFWLIKTDETGFVPEYSSWLLPSLLLTATLVIIIYKKNLFHFRS